MNDAEKEAIRCLGFSLTKVCPRHSEDEECALCDGTGRIYTCEGLGVISKFTQTLQKKQDEIEQYKTQWENAEDSNIKLSEKILGYRKEIERLKNLTHFGYSEVPELKKEIERLTKELSEAEAEVYRLNNSTHCSYCEFEVPLDVDSSVISEHIRTCENHPIRDYEKQIQSLTARNKELRAENEKSDSLRFLNEVNRDKKIKELESKLSGLQEDLFHKEGLLLKSTEKIKELEVLLDKKVLSQVKEDREKILSLESKLAVAREAITKYFESERIDALGYFGVQRKYDTRTAEEFLEKALAELGEKP